jgi:Zn-dependent metalloprotease
LTPTRAATPETHPKETNAMNTLTQSTCSVIPPHILRRLAHDNDPESRDNARATLAEMREIGHDREHTLIEARREQPSGSGKQRNVYDAQHLRRLPGKLVRDEGGPSSEDVEVNEAFDGSGVVWDFYNRYLGRNSIDGKGLRIDSTVHYGVKFDNAMWDGKQMIYGDGDGKLFNRFTSAVDVIGHELTHGVTQYSAGLDYSGQSGALNEHISDAFGIMVKQFAFNQPARESDWLIGAGLLAAGIKGKAIRSMKAPGTAYDDPRLGKDPQPAHMRDYVNTKEDNGGVHINSGIPNKAFYLAATTLGGYAWTALGKVWYATLTTRVTANAKFIHFAKDTVSIAGQLYGSGSNVQRTIAASWQQVGINVPPPPARSGFFAVDGPRPPMRPLPPPVIPQIFAVSPF